MRRLALLASTAIAFTSVLAAPVAYAVPTAPAARQAITSAAVELPPILHFHTHSPAVSVVQRYLGVRPVSGFFGKPTRGAVQRFQRDHGIYVNGIVDSSTWKAMPMRVIRAAKAAIAAAPQPSQGQHGSHSAGSSGRVCPVKKPVWSDGFGADRGDHSHQGVDILSRRGAPIYAVDNGLITGAGMQDNGAIVVDIVGSRGMWFYGHFDEIVVKYGHHVKAGDLLGYMGDTGAYGAVHLHIEYHPGGEFPSPAIDPEPLLRSICS